MDYDEDNKNNNCGEKFNDLVVVCALYKYKWSQWVICFDNSNCHVDDCHYEYDDYKD